MTDIIDPHIHFFNLSKGQYLWLAPDVEPFWPDKYKINRDFFEPDLMISPNNKLLGFVHIEAGFNNQQPQQEIAWLEKSCHLPFRTIAFADITSSDFSSDLAIKLKIIGSMLPERVPIIRPSKGVNPILVSTDSVF